jgi:hypothetical protein
VKLIVRAKEWIHSSILRNDFQVKHFCFQRNIQSNIKYFIFGRDYIEVSLDLPYSEVSSDKLKAESFSVSGIPNEPENASRATGQGVRELACACQLSAPKPKTLPHAFSFFLPDLIRFLSIKK